MCKHKICKILIFLLIGIMMAMLYSCSKHSGNTPGDPTGDPDPSVQSTGEPTTDPAPVGDIYDLTLYQIVYPADCEKEIKELAFTLRDRLSKKLGTGMTLCDDSQKEKPYEILIGATNREVSHSATTDVRYKDFLIQTEGKKIVIFAWDHALLRDAVTHFLLSLGKSNEIYYWSGSYLKDTEYDIKSMKLASHSISDYQIRVPENAGRFVTYTADALRDYIGEKSGYILDIVSGNTSSSDAEILIGFGSGSAALSYQIEAQPGKISINAGSGTAYLNLCDKFGEHFGSQGDVTLSVNDLTATKECQPVSFSENADLRVMTSNVLFSTGKGIYDDATRMECLMQTYLTYLPDVICLQEARNTQFDLLMPWLEDAYASVNFVCDDGGQIYQKILYRKDLYRTVEYGFHRFRPRVIPWGVSWAVLERISDGKQFAVTNTHLTIIAATYDPDKTEAMDGVPMRRSNCEAVVQTIEAIREKYPSVPVFSSGDWNTQRDGEAFAPINENAYMRNALLIAEVSADLNTNSGHTIDQYPSAGTKIIDHIFCSTDTARALVHKVIVNDTVIHGSDHCPVYVEFAFK